MPYLGIILLVWPAFYFVRRSKKPLLHRMNFSIRIFYLLIFFSFNSICQVHNKKSEDYFNLGIAKERNKDFNGAIVDYTSAIKLNPNNSNAYYFRGLCKMMIKDTAAISDFDRAIELKTFHIDVYALRGWQKVRMHNYKDAANDFDKSIELDPKYANAYFYRGSMEIILKKYSEAVADFDKTIEIEPDHIDALYNRGIARMYTKNYTGSLSDFNKVVAADSNYSADVYYFRGIVKLDMDKKSACLDLETAKRMGDADAQAMLDKFCR